MKLLGLVKLKCATTELIAEMGAKQNIQGEWYRYFGGLADKIEGSVIPSDKPGIFNFTRYEPLGVIGMITVTHRCYC